MMVSTSRCRTNPVLFAVLLCALLGALVAPAALAKPSLNRTLICDLDANGAVEREEIYAVWNDRGKRIQPKGAAHSGDSRADGRLHWIDALLCSARSSCLRSPM